MSARKRQRRVIDDDSDADPADVGLATAPARLGRLRRARDDMPAAAEEVIDLCDEPEPGSAARVPPPPPGELVTPQPARQPEAPTTQRRSGLRDRVPSSKKAQQRAALARLHRQRSGAGALEDSDENKGESQDGGSASEGQGAEEGSEEAEEPSSSSDDGFIVSDDDEQGEVARQQLRGLIGGRAMDEEGRMQLYAQTRLLRLLKALPPADSLDDEVKACLAAMLSFERNLQQFEVQSQNLEHWRHADPGMKARFEECEVLETEEGGYRWGKHCSFCRHDRHLKIAMLTLHFRGRRQRVVLLEPVLVKRGLLPGSGCGSAGEHGTPVQPAVGCDCSELEDASDASSGGGGGSASGNSSSSEDDEPLSVSYARRQAVRKQAERQAERAQRAQRRQQQQAGTPLRARQVARELAAAGDGCSIGEDSLLGGAGIARHAAQRRRLAGRKRQRVAIESSDEEEEEEQAEQQQQQQGEEEEEEEEVPASSDGGSQQEEEEDEDEDGFAEQGGEEEAWKIGADPDASDSSASELGKRPRRCPRIGTDCWARAYVHRAIHRYPARLDAMLLYCTRRYLAITREAEQPCSLAGLAHAVVQRYGHPLVKHYNQFMYSINSFNLLQNRKSDKSFANACIVNELKGLQYAHFTQLSLQEELWGVNIDTELAAFTSAAAKRRQRRLGAAAAAAAAGGDVAAAAEEGEDAEEECGRLLLLRAAGGCGPGAADSEDEGQEGDVHYAAEEEPQEPEEPGQRRRPRQRRSQQQQERLETPFLQRQRRSATPQQGGQRAAAAIAAAAAEYGGHGGDGHAQQGAAGRATPQPGSEQRQQREEAARDRNACFYCGGAGHWMAECPERQRCFRCKQIGHWGRDCPLLQRGSCYKCNQPGHWAANCPNG